MNAEPVARASSAAVEHWDQIDWKRCEQRVARLQARIVKASREGGWGKVKALQRLLTCSFSGKALAVKRVTENKGKRTSGVDQVLWSTPQSKLKAIRTVLDTPRITRLSLEQEGTVLKIRVVVDRTGKEPPDRSGFAKTVYGWDSAGSCVRREQRRWAPIAMGCCRPKPKRRQ
jgi:hypothetical protein